jgi:hypothetical protein
MGVYGARRPSPRRGRPARIAITMVVVMAMMHEQMHHWTGEKNQEGQD